MDQDHLQWLIEFTHTYKDGTKVEKRGLNASPMVVKKYEIESDEVMAFSNWDGPNRALTAFHFHPTFPVEQRSEYMWRHAEGHVLLATAEPRRHRGGTAVRAAVARSANRFLTTAASVVGAIVIGVMQGNVR